ncbi:hypothetical protein AN392_01214 [Pseudoalteromonas sp. P1-16-1b]|uniref:hypothetical protein n=1 Tax=Pseudoalteromonas sp. P1-16-1b TaxID=1723757 RepID=UPI0006D65ED2|nr:hypothetical protein [Pseudoalteromonas sp. P1-16-1b]KPZ65666.1 hypothetical protein AN392_01214 [Pseudoalteromonas sp. P1-16-1b]
MKAHTSYISFICWLCIFAFIPGTLVFCFTNELQKYGAIIPVVVIAIAIIPFTLAFNVHKDLANIGDLDGLTQSETARLKQIVNRSKRFVTASVAVLFVVVCLVVVALIMISTIKANYLYTAIAAIGGAELYVLMTLLTLQSNLGEFKSNIANRKKNKETQNKLKEKLKMSNEE